MPDTSSTVHPLRALREARGLTQRQLAQAAGVRQSAISDVEAGRRPNVAAWIIFAIAKALGVAPRDLLPKE